MFPIVCDRVTLELECDVDQLHFNPKRIQVDFDPYNRYRIEAIFTAKI